MIFQIKYWKKDSATETLEEVIFNNEASLKRWYKKLWDEKKVEFSFFDGWNVTLKKRINYQIRTW